jgi:hypothetical protein
MTFTADRERQLLTGFWAGLLWPAYAATGDGDLRAHAFLPSFEKRLDGRVHITHGWARGQALVIYGEKPENAQPLRGWLSHCGGGEGQSLGLRHGGGSGGGSPQGLFPEELEELPEAPAQSAGELHGFAVAAEWSQKPSFVDASRLAARRFVAEMPPAGVPGWKLCLP